MLQYTSNSNSYYYKREKVRLYNGRIAIVIDDSGKNIFDGTIKTASKDYFYL